MKIFIDADGCPVVKNTLKIAKKHGIEAVVVTDTAHYFDLSYGTLITVSVGNDSADFKIANIINPGDILVTQDYALAAMALSRGAVVLNQDGLVFSDDNINALLESRYTSAKLRRSGVRTKGPKKRVRAQTEKFEDVLEGLIV